MAQPNSTGLDGFVNDPQTYSSEFTVEQSIYPADLMGPASPYGNNMVVFYISVQNDSKLVTENAVKFVNGDVLEREGNGSNLANLKLNKRVAKTAIKGEVAAGGVIAGAAVGETGRTVLNTFKSGKKGGWRVGTKFAAGFGGLAALSSGLTRHQTKTTSQAIALYMPNNLSTTYSMGWDSQNTVIGTGAIEAMQAAYEASTAGPSVSSFSPDPVAMAARAVKKGESGLIAGGSKFGSALTSKVLSSTATASRLSATTGNPKKEQIFQGVDFRTFTFDYRFMPRSAAEATKVQNIIKLFKLHQHPEFSPTEGNYFYLYPSEFDIRYYHRASPDSEWVENLNIHRHTSCVLSTMTVNYGDAGVYSSFVDGHPTQISMSLQFKELALLTKENIQHGF